MLFRSTVKLLLARGADLARRDNRGKTALAMALEKGDREAIDALRAAGAKE